MQPTNQTSPAVSNKSLLIAVVLLALAVLGWSWTMKHQPQGNGDMMRNRGGMEQQAPMTDDELKQSIDAGASTNTDADLDAIYMEF